MKQAIPEKQTNDAALKQIFEIFGTTSKIFYDKLCLSHIEIKYNLGKLDCCIAHYNKILVETEGNHRFYWPIQDYTRAYSGIDCRVFLTNHFIEFPFEPLYSEQ